MWALMKNGGLYYLERDIPKLYHGIVHRRCLEKVRDRGGAYFGGLSPDIYAAVALALVSRRVVAVDYPLTIPGACQVSGSVVEGLKKQHSRALTDAPHLRNRGPYQWSAEVPRVYTVETIWADSALAAVRAMGRLDLAAAFNVPRLGALSAWANPDAKTALLYGACQILQVRGASRGAAVLRVGWAMLTAALPRLIRRVWNRLLLIVGVRRILVLRNVTDVDKATSALIKQIDSGSMNFSEAARRAKFSSQPQRVSEQNSIRP